MIRRSILLALLMAASGCSKKSTIDCATNADCLQGNIGGFCHPSPASSESWCAFPDLACPVSAERWGVASGDGLAGACVVTTSPDGGIGSDGHTADAAEPADFAFRFGGVGTDGILKALPASDGSLMVVGTFSGTLMTNGVTLTSSGESDLFIARLRRDGTPVWLRQFGGSGSERAVDLALDVDDAAIVLGTFNGQTNLGSVSHTSQADDLFLMKVDGMGRSVWDHAHGGLDDDHPTGLALAPNGDPIIVGYFETLIDLGDGTQHSAGNADLFLARYSGIDGSIVWSERIGGGGSEYSAGISSVGPNVAIAGQMGGETDLGGGAQSLPDAAAFVAVYSTANGTYSWSRVVPQGSVLTPIYFFGMSLLHDGSIAACARFTADADFGGGTLSPSDGAFLGRYRVGGSLLWSRQLGSTGGGVTCEALAVDRNDRIFVTGEFGGVVDFGNDVLTSSQNNHSDLFLAAFSADDEPLRAIGFHAAGDEHSGALVAEPETVVTGGFGGDLLLDDGTTLTSVGAVDSFVIGRVFP